MRALNGDRVFSGKVLLRISEELMFSLQTQTIPYAPGLVLDDRNVTIKEVNSSIFRRYYVVSCLHKHYNIHQKKKSFQ